MAVVRKLAAKTPAKKMARPASRSQVRPPDDLTELQQAMLVLNDLRIESDTASAAVRTQSDHVLGLMEESTAVVTLPDGSSMRATVTARTTSSLDEGKLKKKVGPIAFKKLMTLMFDRGKLDLAIKNGEIDPVVVASCMEETEGAQHLRITKR